MPTTLDGTAFSMAVRSTLNNVLDLSVIATATLNMAKSSSFSTGTGANQADRMFFDSRNILASANDDLDLNGTTLIDALGVPLALARLKLLAIYAYPGNANNIVMDGAASARITTMMGGTTPTLTIRPGGMFLLTAPDATAYAITATTADILRITNGGAGTSVNYDIVAIGASA